MKQRSRAGMAAGILLAVGGAIVVAFWRTGGPPGPHGVVPARGSNARASQAVTPSEEVAQPSPVAPATTPPASAAREGSRTSLAAAPPQAQPSIHGRVFDARTGAGVAGCKVKIGLPDDVQVHVLSDAEGLFRLDPGVGIDAESVSYYPRPPKGWRWRKLQFFYASPANEAQRSGEEAIEIEVAETLTDYVSGRVVSNDTGEPLEAFSFWLQKRRERADCVSAADGTFVTDVPLSGGVYTIGSQAGHGYANPREIDLLVGEELELRIDVDPVVELELSGEVAPIEELKLWTFFTGQQSQGRDHATPVRRRSDGSLWARPAEQGLHSGQPVVYAVSDDEGFTYGSVERAYAPEGYPEPLAIELFRTGGVEVVLRPEIPQENANGNEDFLLDEETPEAHKAFMLLGEGDYPGVVFEPLDGQRWTPPPSWRGRSQWLPPGRYQAVASSRIHERVVQPFVVLPGERVSLEVDLPLLGDVWTVKGAIRTESGEPVTEANVVLTSLASEPPQTFRASILQGWCGTGMDLYVEVREDGTGAFRMDRVPRGPYRVEDTGTRPVAITCEERDGGLWIDVLQLDRPGGPGMAFDFEQENRWTTARIETRVFDDGAELHGFAAPRVPLTRDLPRERRLEWAFLLSKHRPVYGTQDDFAEGEDGLWIARVEPEPGWGTRVLVRGADGAPVPGAEILIDDEPAGWADGEGLFELQGEHPPKTLQAVDPLGGARSPRAWLGERAPLKGWWVLTVGEATGER